MTNKIGNHGNLTVILNFFQFNIQHTIFRVFENIFCKYSGFLQCFPGFFANFSCENYYKNKVHFYELRFAMKIQQQQQVKSVFFIALKL